jgi:predicted short-subunit dehydrogenase-like oxidoreductase (DUF2520 family)
MIRYNISFVGAGRVAEALCMALYNAGMSIRQIVSETETNGSKLARRCKAVWSPELLFTNKTNVIIVSVPDHRLSDVLSMIVCRKNTIVAHTAGSFGLEVFPPHITRTGVLYPLQTFSKGRKVNFTNLPFFIEASDTNTLNVLKNLSEYPGGIAHIADTEHRRLLHLAAVFVCNFTNHMLFAGEKVSTRAGISFEVLEPLLKETISKAIENGPGQSQTGPAMRHDMNTVKKHLELLSFSPGLQDVYREVSKSIMSFYENN